MIKVTQAELEPRLVKHGKWLRNEEGGERAGFSGQDVSGLNFQDADCRLADFEDANCKMKREQREAVKEQLFLARNLCPGYLHNTACGRSFG